MTITIRYVFEEDGKLYPQVFLDDTAYRIHFWYTSKDDLINIMTNSNLVDKRGVIFIFYQRNLNQRFIIKETEK